MLLVSLFRLHPSVSREIGVAARGPRAVSPDKEAKAGSMVFSGKLPTYPSRNLTLTLTSFFGQNVRFGEGEVGSFSETIMDPKSLTRSSHARGETHFGVGTQCV